MSDLVNAQAALIRASWIMVAANRPQGRPVECLSDMAIEHARALSLAGLGTITFTANREAAEAVGLVAGDRP